MPLPRPGAYLREVEVVATPLGSSAEITQTEGRLEVRLGLPEDGIVSIGAELSFLATPPADSAKPGQLNADQAELYLRPTEGLIRVTPRIQALADALAGANGPFAAVTAFWNYMIDELVCGAVHYDTVAAGAPGDWVLDSGWYDCQLGAAMLVSLCRARGIPARILSGHVLYRLAPTNHYWCEAWIDGYGWLPFDFLSWDLSAGGRDPAWRDHFARQVDYRMLTQCLPLEFTGPMSVRLPSAWQMTQVGAQSGIEIAFSDLADGSLVYSDHITVHPRSPVPGR